MPIKFEQYINKNRALLDVENPEEAGLWEGIRKEIILKQKLFRFFYWKVAGIVFIIIGLSISLNYGIFTSCNQCFSLMKIDKGLGKIEKAYIKTVKQKAKLANISNTNQDEITQTLLYELAYLDTIYFEAINDLKQSGYLDQIVNIIFDTYEKRIEILEQIIHETQKQKINESTNPEVNL